MSEEIPALGEERLPGDAPMPAKVIVVTDYAGKERRFAADSFGYGLLGVHVKRGGAAVAYYPGGTFLSVREASADVDALKQAAGRALTVLRHIGSVHVDDGDSSLRAVRDAARSAAAEIEELGR